MYEEKITAQNVDSEELFLKRVYRDFGNSLKRLKGWIVFYIFLIVVGTSVFVSFQPVLYRATTTILIDSAVVTDPSEQKSLNNLDLQATIIQSPEVLDRVLNKKETEDEVGFLSELELRENLSQNLETEVDNDNKTIKIHFIDTRPTVAAEIANQIAQEYLYGKAAKSSGVSVESADALQKKAAQEMDRLKEVKIKIAQINKEHPDFGSESVIADQIRFLNNEFIKTDSRVLQLKTTISEMDALMQSGVSIENQPSFVAHPRVRDKAQKIRDAELSVLEQTQEYRDQHPLVLKAKARLAALKNSLEEEKTLILAELQAELKGAELTVAKIQENMMALQAQEKELTPQKMEYKALLGEETAVSKTIELLNGQISKAAVASSFKQTGIEILSFASLPKEPFKPNKPKSLFIAFIFAVVSSFGWIFLRCYFDRTFKSEEDIEQFLMKPFLGHLPFVKVPKGKVLPKFLSEKEEIYFSNFTRLICANISFLISGKGKMSLLITGSKPGEGKSFVSYHVAKNFAQEGKRTVLVDTDFCRGILSNYFSNLVVKPGLHEYLTGTTEKENILTQTEQENLFFIRCDEIEFSAPHALRSDRMKDLVRKLKAEFEIVIFDTPPVLAVNDAVALGELVDMRILVIEWGKTSQEIATRALRKIAPSNLVFAGIILNKAKHWGSSYYYNHYYESGKKRKK